MLKKRITSIEELELEQQKLRMGMQVTKDAFSKSLGTNRKELKNYLVKKVAVPAGIAGLGMFAANKLTATKEKKVVKNSTNILGELMPLAIDIFQTFLLQRNQQDINQVEENQSEPHSEAPDQPHLKPVS